MNTQSGAAAGSPINAYLVARILLAIVFIVSGINIIMAFPFVAADAGNLGIPVPTVAVGLSVALDIIGGLLVIANRFAWAVGLLWIGLLIIATPIFHWPMANGAVDPNNLNHFLKNVSLAGGILLLVIMDKSRPAALSWLDAK